MRFCQAQADEDETKQAEEARQEESRSKDEAKAEDEAKVVEETKAEGKEEGDSISGSSGYI